MPKYVSMFCILFLLVFACYAHAHMIMAYSCYNQSIIQLTVSGTTGQLVPAPNHAEAELGLTLVQKRIQLYMEVTNAQDLRLSLKVVMSRSAQVHSALNESQINHVTLGWFIFIH